MENRQRWQYAADPWEQLPGVLLERVLTFLTEASIPNMCRVCQTWNEEIGTQSPALWKHLLHLRNWPPPLCEDAESERDAYRNAFLAHYSTIRNMQAIKAATRALVMGRAVKEKEMVMQAFSNERDDPQFPDMCIEVKVWSPNRVLAAYYEDCTLRLFEAVERSDSDTNSCPRRCQEVVCVRAAPVKNTIRSSCKLRAMDVDEDMIGCLCKSKTETERKVMHSLVVMSREAFLCSGGPDLDHEGTINVIDIGEAVLDWLLCCEDVDHSLPIQELLSWLYADASNVEVYVSPSVVACGYGRFLVEVQITMQTDEYCGEERAWELWDRKLVLFSAKDGAIVWMGHSSVLKERFHWNGVELACSRRPCIYGDSRSACSIAVVSSFSPMILTLEIEPNGCVGVPQALEASELVRSEIREDGWEGLVVRQRAVVTSSDIVVAENVSRRTENGSIDRKSVLSFYPRTPVDDSGKFYSTLVLDGRCEAVRMDRIGDHHVVVMCRVYSVNASRFEEQAAVHAFVLHVPSRQEIQRICLLEDTASSFPEGHRYDIPIFLAAAGDTIGVGVCWKGVILTGDDVRSVGQYRDR